jgi:hypothetical protein
MPEENISLRDLKMMGRVDPTINRFLDRILVERYDEFIEALYQDFDCIITLIQENAELRQEDSEDRLTLRIN